MSMRVYMCPNVGMTYQGYYGRKRIVNTASKTEKSSERSEETASWVRIMPKSSQYEYRHVYHFQFLRLSDVQLAVLSRMC